VTAAVRRLLSGRSDADDATSVGLRPRERLLGTGGVVGVMAASWQDRDGGKTTLLSAYLASPIRHVFADQGFAGRLVDWAATRLNMRVEIVRKPAEQRGFAVHPDGGWLSEVWRG
jgi:hypothetical protein